MRYPAEHKRLTRARIVHAAAHRFRQGGSAGTAINDLMRDLHLTHGGFYRHFRSKEELFAEAVQESLDQISGRVMGKVEQAPRSRKLKTLIEGYLSEEHCFDVGGGCPVAALAGELVRHSEAVRAAFMRVLEDNLERISRYMPGRTSRERERKARVVFSGMAGILTMARVVVDDKRRREFLRDARKFYLASVAK